MPGQCRAGGILHRRKRSLRPFRDKRRVVKTVLTSTTRRFVHRFPSPKTDVAPVNVVSANRVVARLSPARAEPWPGGWRSPHCKFEQPRAGPLPAHREFSFHDPPRSASCDEARRNESPAGLLSLPLRSCRWKKCVLESRLEGADRALADVKSWADRGLTRAKQFNVDLAGPA